MAHIYYGDRRRVQQNLDVVAAISELSDDYWALLEFDIPGANIDCLLIKPTRTGTEPAAPSPFIMTEFKRVAGRLSGLEHTPWFIERNGIRGPLASSNSEDINPWQQTLRALNTFQKWFTTNQMVFLDRPEPHDGNDIKVWPVLLVIRTDSTERHALPPHPGNRFGSYTFSVDQWLQLVSNWRPYVGIQLCQEDVERIVQALYLQEWDEELPKRPSPEPEVATPRMDETPAATETSSADLSTLRDLSKNGFPPSLAWVEDMIAWAVATESRIKELEERLADAPSGNTNGPVVQPTRGTDLEPVSRPLTEDERRALIAAVKDAARSGRPRSFPDVLSLINVKLGYDLKSRDYNGFYKARAFFDQAVRDDIIEYGPNAGPAPTIYLAGEQTSSG